MAPHKEKPTFSSTESGTWKINKIKIGNFVLNPMTWLIACVGSLTPFGQWSLSKIGVSTPNGDIEAIKKVIEGNKAQIERLDSKVSTLVVEFEKLRYERHRTAGQ